MHHFNQHSLSLKVRVVIRSYLHAEQTKTYACIMQLIHNNGRSESLCDKERYVTLTRVSDTCLYRSWPLYLSQSLKSLRFTEETTFRRTRSFLIKYGGRSPSCQRGLKKLTNSDLENRQKLMFQLDMITLTVNVQFNGYVVVIPALSLRYKHRSKTRYLACSCWLQLG